MASSLDREPEEIVVTAIRSLPTSTGRRTLQSDTDGGSGAGIAVDFEILAVEGEVAEAESAAVALQESDTPIALSLGGTTILVTPSAAMTPPAAPVAADIDCEGSWECLAGTEEDAEGCSIPFTRRIAQSGDGAACPPEP